MRLLIAIAILSLACVSGCSSIRTDHALTGAPSAPYPRDVQVVLEGQSVPPGLEEVAMVAATGDGSLATREAVIEALEREAASLGCSFVARVQVEQKSGYAIGIGVASRPRSAPLAASPAARAAR